MARYSRNIRAEVDLPKARVDRESLREALRLFGFLRPYRRRFVAAGPCGMNRGLPWF